MTTTTSITSEEVNYLIYRYLQEAGFVHSAFTFGQESFIGKADIKPTVIPPGMLISLLQRGLHFASIEYHINDDGSEKDCTKPYSLLEPHICEKPPSVEARVASTTLATTSSIQTAIRTLAPVSRGRPSSTQRVLAAGNLGSTAAAVAIGQIKEKEKETKRKKRAEVAVEEEEDVVTPNPATNIPALNVNNSKPRSTKGNANKRKPSTVANILPASSSFGAMQTHGARCSVLKGHESEVVMVAWNPKDDKIIASVSADGTARIWHLPERPRTPTGSMTAWKEESVKVLVHQPLSQSATQPPSNGDQGRLGAKTTPLNSITTMEWSPDGKLLATACFDGGTRVWSLDGELHSLLTNGEGHSGPVYQVEWSPDGQLLATAGIDPPVVVWKILPSEDKDSNRPLKIYKKHTKTVLDIDWCGSLLASCASDHLICIYDIDKTEFDEPVLVLEGHTNEVNSIQWSPSGEYLLSCSDDKLAKIWHISRSIVEDTEGENRYSCDSVLDLADHTKEIYTSKWCGNNLIATASFDGTVKLWEFSSTTDRQSVTCLRTLRRHRERVYALAFDPSISLGSSSNASLTGNKKRLLASGSLDGSIVVWRADDGGVLDWYSGKGGVFEISWNSCGDALVACTAEKELILLDLRPLIANMRVEEVASSIASSSPALSASPISAQVSAPVLKSATQDVKEEEPSLVSAGEGEEVINVNESKEELEPKEKIYELVENIKENGMEIDSEEKVDIAPVVQGEAPHSLIDENAPKPIHHDDSEKCIEVEDKNKMEVDEPKEALLDTRPSSNSLDADGEKKEDPEEEVPRVAKNDDDNDILVENIVDQDKGAKEES